MQRCCIGTITAFLMQVYAARAVRMSRVAPLAMSTCCNKLQDSSLDLCQQESRAMASELSKLIEDQLQEHDEEAPLSPTEKQRLLSSSLRIKVVFTLSFRTAGVGFCPFSA